MEKVNRNPYSIFLSTFLVLAMTMTFAVEAKKDSKDHHGKKAKSSKHSKYIKIYSSQGETKNASIRGVIGLPSYVLLTRGYFRDKRAEAVIKIDDSVECFYNEKKNYGLFVKYYFSHCSSGSRPGERINVKNGVSFSVSANSKLSMKATIKVHEYFHQGVELPNMGAVAGQFLQFDGELWAPAEVLADGQESGQVLMWDGLSWTPSELPTVQGPVGADGAPGATGAQGPAGLQGEKGEKGDKGDKGDIGPQGLAGVAGAQGPQGDKGDKGDVGPQGPAGVAGAPGLPGIQGPAGLNGEKGNKGDKGDVGPEGPAGIQGPQGPTGAAGSQGSVGPAGAQGPQGLPGVQGPAGIQGIQGEVGPQGEAGKDATVSLTAGAGIVGAGIVGGTITSTGTIAVDVGTNKGQIPQLDDNGKLPASVIPDDIGGGAMDVVLLKDVRPNGTHGGDCTAGVWHQRALNTLEGEGDFISLAGNQMTLQPGTYLVEVNAPTYLDNIHKAIFFNLSTNATALVGSTGRTHVNYGGMNSSLIRGLVTVAAAESFEVRHRCSSDRTIVGFGLAASFGVDEVYTQVKIVKIK